MQRWLLFGVLGYLFFAISSAIDKYMMNQKQSALRTNTLKMFFDASILLVIGIIFFNLNFTAGLVLWSLLLGTIYAISGTLYFSSLNLKDVGGIVPFFQSSSILLVFISSIFIFNELVNRFNYFGVALILIGIYLVVSEKAIKIPRLDKGVFLISLAVILNVIYVLIVKKLLFSVEPINLVIMMYFSTTIALTCYHLIFKRQNLKALFCPKPKMILRVIITALFASIGNLLIYSALSLGNASKVYPIAGLQSVFVFGIASFFLREKFYWHRLAGIFTVFLGIFLISL